MSGGESADGSVAGDPSILTPPGPVLPPPSPPILVGAVPYRRPGWVAVVAQVVLLVAVVSAAVAAGVTIAERRLVGRMLNSPASALVDELDAADDRRVVFSAVASIAFLAGTGFVIAWTRRLYGNLRALGVQDLRFGVGWAVGGWFVPLFNLVRPKQIVDDIWRGSDPSPSWTGGWRESRVPLLLHVWWATGIAALVLRRLGGNDDTANFESFHGSMAWDAAGFGALAVGAVLTLAVVRRLTERQEQCASVRLAVAPTRRRAPAAAAVIGLSLLGVLALGAGFVLVDSDTDATAQDRAVLEDLQVGDCFDGPDGLPLDGEAVSIASVDVLPCDVEHDGEVFAVVQHPAAAGAAYIGDDAIFEFGYDECQTAFEGAIGEPYEQSFLDLVVNTPGSIWEFGDRSILCVALHPWGRKLEATVLEFGFVTAMGDSDRR